MVAPVRKEMRSRHIAVTGYTRYRTVLWYCYTMNGQFDDAPEDQTTQQIDSRQGPAYIDDATLEWSDPEDGSGDDEVYEEDYTDDRVEDEDWEVAERGSFSC